MDSLTIADNLVSTEPPFLATDLESTEKKPRSFILGNTTQSSLKEIRERHIIPTFLKDNEPFISHNLFIETMQGCAHEVFKRRNHPGANSEALPSHHRTYP